MPSEDEPCQWMVFECRPGEVERVAGEVTATTFEDAWQKAQQKFGECVNHVQAKKEQDVGG
jgi:hypothetical protein